MKIFLLSDRQNSNYGNAIHHKNRLSCCFSCPYSLCGYYEHVVWYVSWYYIRDKQAKFHSTQVDFDIKTIKCTDNKCFLLDYNDNFWEWRNIGHSDITQVNGIPKIVAMDIINEDCICLIGANGLLYRFDHNSCIITTSNEFTDALGIFYDKYFHFVICKKGNRMYQKPIY